MVAFVTHYLNWVDLILIGWVLISALVTPLVGRFLGQRFSDSSEEKFDQPLSSEHRHDPLDV